MGYHIFNRRGRLAEDLHFLLQIPDPLLGGGKVAAISVTYPGGAPQFDALLALPPVKTRFGDPKTGRGITNGPPIIKQGQRLAAESSRVLLWHYPDSCR